MSHQFAESLFDLLEQASAHERNGRIADAEAAYREVLARDPRHARAAFELGRLAMEDGRLEEAAACLRGAIRAAPSIAEYHSLFGLVLLRSKMREAALNPHAIAVQLAPANPEFRVRLGEAQWRAGHLAAAAASLERALELDPALAGAHRLLAQVRYDSGLVDEALAEMRRLLPLDPESWRVHDTLTFLLHFHPASTRASLQAEHAAWNEKYAVPLRKYIVPHSNDRTPERRLRIGYVSADFCDHAVAYTLIPLFSNHDRTQFEIVAYSGVRTADDMTVRFKRHVDFWRDVARWSDEKLADCIRTDGIDLLIDLSLHSAGHRLFVFARRPAPIQVTWAGYPGGTGLDAIDYRLTDRFLDPPGGSEACYAEKSVRLPDSFWCYDPVTKTPAVNPSPALATGTVAFGCLNKPMKVNLATIALWARVLRALPTSRMILMASADAVRSRIAGWFCEHGVDPARLEFVGRQARQDYLRVYHRIDIALDPTPYGGHITLCDALWMGVPTLALPGETAVARAGLSLLMHAGLPDWIATTPDDFVHIAREQTRDLDRLARVRAELRARLMDSPLMDAGRFARGMESVYRAMWRTWCAGGSDNLA